MAEFDPHATVEDAIDAAARGLVKRSRQDGQEVEYYDLKDLLEASKFAAEQTARTKPHFGIRMTKLIPPGTG